MKKIICALLALVMVLSLAACSGESGLFSDTSSVKFEDLYTHKDPSDLKYSERKELINKDFASLLTETVNSAAYPDTMKYDDAGNMIGAYDYDPTTGMASGYTNFETGEVVAEEKNLGMPDESMMISLKSDVVLGAVAYGTEDKAIAFYLYAFLGDVADKELVMTNMEACFGFAMTEESEKVLVCKLSEADIDAQFHQWEEAYGQPQSDRTVSGYIGNIRSLLGLKNYGVNPFAPAQGITDPENLDFDQKVYVTANGSYSFTDTNLEKDIKGRTDVVYAKEGKVVGYVIYYEYNTKDGADKLFNTDSSTWAWGTPERVSDTVIRTVITSDMLNQIISDYISYNVLKDDSVEDFTRMLEETYFGMVYEK